MAGTLTRLRQTLSNSLRGGCALLSLLAADFPLANAAGASDPFTPPLAALRALSGSAVGPAAGVAAMPIEGQVLTNTSTAIGANNAEPASKSLTGVRVGRAPAALFNGQWVPLGQNVGDAVLTQVALTGATLRHADGRLEQLNLSPGIHLGKSLAATHRAAESKR